MQDDLGYFDDETRRLKPIENPFGSKVLPMSTERPPVRGGWHPSVSFTASTYELERLGPCV